MVAMVILRVRRCVGCRAWVSEIDGIACCQACGVLAVDDAYDCRLTRAERWLFQIVLHRPGVEGPELIETLWPNPNDEVGRPEIWLAQIAYRINQKTWTFRLDGGQGRKWTRRSIIRLPAVAA